MMLESPNKILQGEELNQFLKKSREYHLQSVKDHFADYEPNNLYQHWLLLVRCIDELINIPLEIEDIDLVNEFLSLSFNLFDQEELKRFQGVLGKVKVQFSEELHDRMFQFAMMNCASTMAYEKEGLNKYLPYNFSTVESAIVYYQSRRKYYVTILDLIPEWASGSTVFPFIDTLNQFQYTLDSCLVNITSSYFGILLNNSIAGYSVDFSSVPPKPSLPHNNLESFLLEPQRLSMLDQLEFRPDQIDDYEPLEIPSNKVFSFLEIENHIKLIQATFRKYSIEESSELIEIKFLVQQIKEFCKDDFDIIVPKQHFEENILKYIRKTPLIKPKSDYFDTSNFVSAFQLMGDSYFSTVVLLNRYIQNLIMNSLEKNRSFQINSGFVFEDKVASILERNGYELTNITRINRKEFDLITIRENRIYNFQCKNNFIDISRIQDDPFRMAKLNRRLISYYVKAYEKEVNREKLITDKLKISEIEHFVISRYPVITEIAYIINFNNLENWIIQNAKH